VTAGQDFLPGRLRILPNEFLKTRWLRKDVGCMARLRDLGDNTSLQILYRESLVFATVFLFEALGLAAAF
jgi:hypothetical protein